MQKNLIVFGFFFVISTFTTIAQTKQESMAKIIRNQLGENCIVKDENGKQLSFEEAAEIVLSVGPQGKRVKYDPFKVVNGQKQIVILKVIEAAAMKPLIDEIDFSKKELIFYDASMQKISGEEFKNILRANTALMASVYNAENGIKNEFQIITRPQPQAISTTTQNGVAVGDAKTVTMANPQNGTTITTATNDAANSIAFSVGKNLPEFKMKDMNGKTWDTKDLQDKIVVMNFWFVECMPCIAEMPALNKLVEKYKGNDKVVFLSISSSNTNKIKDFLATKSFTYNHIAKEESKAYWLDWEIEACPQNTIAANGKVIFTFTGGISDENYMFNLLDKHIAKSLSK